MWNYVLVVRHHHETFVGLRPRREAPPQNLRGITSWLWGTTTKPSWNYVLVMRHHHKIFVELRPYMRHHHELSPRGSWNYVCYMRHHHELPLGGPMGLRPLVRHHHEIPLWESWDYILPIPCPCFTNQIIEFPCIPISCQYIYK